MGLAFRGPTSVPVTLKIDGRVVKVLIEPRRTLLSVLREELGLTGAKRGCGRGQCGACTVVVDGETAYACLTLAIDCEGREIRTVDGLTLGERLHPVQEAFVAHDAYQCGFCTPGQVMSAVALLEHDPNPSADEIRREMAGNLCRCGAYPNIVRAILAAAEEGEGHADD
jgi:xanthine dehydrogenase YagT iron-sulfur-binding subunit